MGWHEKKQRQSEASEIRFYIASFNDSNVTRAAFFQQQLELSESQGLLSECKSTQPSLLELLVSRTMRTRTIMAIFTWSVVSLLYYGFNDNTSKLIGNVYANCALQGFVEIIVFYYSGEI